MPRALASLLALAVISSVALAGDGATKTIDNPEYASWSKHKVGTWVRIRTDSEMSGTTSTMKMTTKLVSVAADKLVVETSTTISAAGQEFTTPAQPRDVPAKLEVPAQGTVEGETAPKPKEGDEEIEVAGRKVKAHWIETATTVGDTTSRAKVWQSAEVPGGLARMETKTEGAATGTTTLVVEEWASGE